MVKPKKPKIGIWKTIEVKGRRKHQKEKSKPVHGELPAKSQNQNNVKDASRPKSSKQAKSTPRQRFHGQDRQWNYSPMTILFPLHGSHMPMPCGPHCSMLYSCPSWYYNLCIPPLSRYLCPDYIIYREPVIS
jgi:hypothetical protein